MHTIATFQDLSASKLQSLNSKPCILSVNPGCFTVFHVDALTLSAGNLQRNGTKKKPCTHKSKIKITVLKSH